ncbi:FAD-dependent oxidoreductase [Streptomyces sp. NPDC047061]|uniref:NAD(P)/FAD-dependent oxidoreductase n=1 Tax=Streptomyces sp. NPDC047061 TaxID=3154605 RepID=UPI0033E82090
MSSGLLVVGGGQAAVQVACSLRESGWQYPITIVGEEVALPYQRPPLSKAFLAGKADAESLALRSDDYFAREGIEVVRGEHVTQVTAPCPDGTAPGAAVTSEGRAFEFAHLALTVGASPRRLRLPGSDLLGISYLRDLSDAETLKRDLAVAKSVVVIGGGFIGLEAAAVARARGLDVTVLEAADRLIGRVVAPVVSEFYREAHERRGTKVRLGASVVGFQGREGRVTAVELADGTTVPADLVVVGIGVVPRLALAEQLGLECDNGIVVDEYARTSHPRVVAAGDCTTTSHLFAGGARVRLESVQNAVDQAKCAAATIAGRAEPYTSVPWFWSDQDTLKLQIAGLSSGFDTALVRGRPEEEKFSVLYYRDGQLLAVDAVNSPRDYMAVRRALAAGRTIDPERVTDMSTALTPV